MPRIPEMPGKLTLTVLGQLNAVYCGFGVIVPDEVPVLHEAIIEQQPNMAILK